MLSSSPRVLGMYDVISTFPKRNSDEIECLGFTRVFDYNDPKVIEKVAVELDKGECAGIFMAACLNDGNAAALKVAAAYKHMIWKHISHSTVLSLL